jgi:hypothetical protein
MSIGLDIGTMNIVSASQEGDEVKIRRIRDAFLDLPSAAKKVLKLSGASFMQRKDDILLLGDRSLEMAIIFGREVRRPLSQGLVSPSEIDSLEVLGYLIRQVLGDPKEDMVALKDEICFYSIPAPPIDNPEKDVIYHKGVFHKIVTECGFRAVPSNEAMAIVFSEAMAENFSALSFSFGSGMTNIALAFNGLEGMVFSVERGGDWIDAGAARSLGSPQSRLCHIKESGVDLLAPANRDEEALVFYYKELINYVLEWVHREFQRKHLHNVVTSPIPIILSGGTSLAAGFESLFKKEFQRRKNFPLKVSEIRTASDPLNAVAKGLLIQAKNEEEE